MANFNIEDEINDNIEDNIDLGRIFRSIFLQSKLLLALLFIGFSIGTLMYVTSTKIFKISSLLQIYSSQSTNFQSEIPVDFLLGSSNSSDLRSLEILYKTRSNIIEIIKKLKLNVTIRQSEYRDLLTFDEFEIKDVANLEARRLYLTFHEDDYEIFDNNEVLISRASYGETYTDGNLSINIPGVNFIDDERIEIIYQQPEDIFKTIQSKIKIQTFQEGNYFSPKSGIMEITYDTENVQKGIKIISLANEIFIRNSIENETEKARKAIEFIDQRIADISENLNQNKFRLKEFQEKNKSLNVDLEVEAIIEKITAIEAQIGLIDIELAKAANSYTESNPIYINFIDQKNELLNQKRAIEGQIRDLPFAQQEYIDLYRDVEISQELYTELENRRLGFSIMEASTLGNIRVVDNAYNSSLVSPRITSLILSFLMTVLFSLIIVVLRGIYFLPITNPAELSDNNIKLPILGVIPLLEENPDSSSSERFQQSLQSAIVNVKSLEKPMDKATTILVTSATKENGKSLYARYLAKTLASIGSKVLLVDADLKRGNQHKQFQKSTIKENIFKNMHIDNLEDFKVEDNLYLIPRIKGLASTFSFLSSSFYTEKFNSVLKENFDYIIIDTAPVLSVSDTLLLTSLSDINLVMVRHNLTKINEIKQLFQITSQSGINVDGVIYNAYEKPRGYYGYYDLYGNYNYQYYAQRYLYQDYDYKEDNS